MILINRSYWRRNAQSYKVLACLVSIWRDTLNVCLATLSRFYPWILKDIFTKWELKSLIWYSSAKDKTCVSKPVISILSCRFYGISRIDESLIVFPVIIIHESFFWFCNFLDISQESANNNRTKRIKICLCGFSRSPEDTNTFIGKILVCGFCFEYSISQEKLDMFLAKYNLPLRQWIYLQAPSCPS